MKRSSTLNLVLIFTLTLLFPALSSAQKPVFTRQDTLRGSITPERSWWDLTYYHLDIVVNPSDSTIYGKNTVTYRVVKPATLMQIDLQEPMQYFGSRAEWKAIKIYQGRKCLLD